MTARRDGIDVSRYQGDVDWRAVRAQGMAWSACKATQGRRWVDPTFSANRAGMAAAGFPVRLFYHWLSHDVPATVQAAHFLRTVGGLAVGEGVMLDAEEDGITLAQCIEWCRLVEAATGRPVAVYTGVYVAGRTIWQSPVLFDGRRARVLAAYTSEARARRIAAPHAWDAWQWTGSGTVAGVDGPVDIDQVDHMPAFLRACGYPTTTPEPSEEDTVKTLDRPQRIYDSRTTARPLKAGEVLKVPVLGNEVVVNVTVVDPDAAGYLTVWGAGERPETSNVNFRAGSTVANLARTKTDGGVIRIQSTATCHVVVDLQAAG